MGFHSRTCPQCGDSIKAPYNLSPSLAWQNDVVAVLADGTTHTGTYDGYGRLETDSGLVSLHDDYTADYAHAWFHAACHKAAGEPAAVVKASPPAADQGYFYADEDCIHTPPKGSA